MSRSPARGRYERSTSPVPRAAAVPSAPLDPISSRRVSTTSSPYYAHDTNQHGAGGTTSPSPAAGRVALRDEPASARYPRPDGQMPLPSRSAAGPPRPHRSEILVIVRPPPSQIRHPLNLQVQLIKKQQQQAQRQSGELDRSDTNLSYNAIAEASVTGTMGPSSLPLSTSGSVGREREAPPRSSRSSESSDEDEDNRDGQEGGNGRQSRSSSRQQEHYGSSSNGTTLMTPPDQARPVSRSGSVRSDRSATSFASSHGSSHYSTSSAASTQSGSRQRRVIPCYNLEFHSLQPSFVTDASTDVKIARIHKKGVEMLDFAFLDPVFLGQAESIPPLVTREQSRRTAELSRTTSSTQEFIQKPTNLLNKLKRFSFKASSSNSNHHTSDPSTSSGDPATTSPSKFKNALLGLSSAAPPSQSTGGSLQNQQAASSPEIPVVPLFREKSQYATDSLSSPKSGAASPAKQQSLTPTTTAGSSLARHAPGYVWVVRQYIRKDLVNESGREGALCEVTFEWRKRRRRPPTKLRPSASAQNGTSSSFERIGSREISKGTDSRTEPLNGIVSSEDRSLRRHSAHMPGLISGSAGERRAIPTTHLREPSGESTQSRSSTPRNAVSMDLPRSAALQALTTNTLTPIRSSDSPVMASSPSMPWSSPSVSLLGKGFDRAADLLNPNKYVRARSGGPPDSNTARHAQSSLSSHRGDEPPGSPTTTPANPLASSLSNPERNDYTLPSQEPPARYHRSASPAPSLSLTQFGSTSDLGHGRSSVEYEETAKKDQGKRNSVISLSDVKTEPELDEDSGDESDPEDSERPWICELVVKRVMPGVHEASASTRRTHLGTLTPAPHHPKLVAHLSVPLALRPTNIAMMDDEPPVVFTIEELKDAMTVTGLWLVVRESLGLGGIHKTRKNEGAWRFTTPAALKAG